MSSAMSLDVGANNASQIVGPTIGGILLASVGIGGVFCVSVVCYSLALIAAWRVGYRNPAVSTSTQSIVVRMAEGLALVRRDPRLVATLIVTIISNVFAWPATSMIPVIGHDRLRLGAVGIGVLSSMTGVGAFCGAVAIAFAARQAQFSRICTGTLSVVVGHGVADDRCGECLLQHHAGDTRLSCGAGRDAQPHLWRPIRMHRRRDDRLYPDRPPRRADRRFLGGGGNRCRRHIGDAVDPALVASTGRGGLRRIPIATNAGVIFVKSSSRLVIARGWRGR
jgi:hypothetical protein